MHCAGAPKHQGACLHPIPCRLTFHVDDLPIPAVHAHIALHQPTLGADSQNRSSGLGSSSLFSTVSKSFLRSCSYRKNFTVLMVPDTAWDQNHSAQGPPGPPQAFRHHQSDPHQNKGIGHISLWEGV